MRLLAKVSFENDCGKCSEICNNTLHFVGKVCGFLPKICGYVQSKVND